MLKPPFENGDRSQARVDKMSHLYKQLEDLKLKKDSQIFKQEVTKIHSYSEQIKQIFTLISKYQVDAVQSVKKLDQEFNQLNVLKHRLEYELSDLEKAHSMEKGQYNDLKNQYIFKKKQRVAISETINLKPLVKLEIQDRKAQCHEVFIWLLVVLYKQPSGKYYWQNFKEQAFQEDGGADFIQRLGKLSATDLKQQQKVITQKLINNRSKYQKAPEFQEEGVVHEIKKIIDIAGLFLDGFEISKKSKELDKQDSKTKDERILKDESIAKMKAKLNAIQDRKNLSIRYSRTLQTIEAQLKSKESSYSNIELEGLKIIKELKSFDNGNGDLNSVSIHHQLERRHQKCLLF